MTALGTLFAQEEALASIGRNIEGKMKALQGMLDRDRDRVKQQEQQLAQYRVALLGIQTAYARVSEDIAASRLTVFPESREG